MKLRHRGEKQEKPKIDISSEEVINDNRNSDNNKYIEVSINGRTYNMEKNEYKESETYNTGKVNYAESEDRREQSTKQLKKKSTNKGGKKEKFIVLGLGLIVAIGVMVVISVVSKRKVSNTPIISKSKQDTVKKGKEINKSTNSSNSSNKVGFTQGKKGSLDSKDSSKGGEDNTNNQKGESDTSLGDLSESGVTYVNYKNVLLNLSVDYPSNWYTDEKSDNILNMLKMTSIDGKFNIKENKLTGKVQLIDFKAFDVLDTRVSISLEGLTNTLSSSGTSGIDNMVKSEVKAKGLKLASLVGTTIKQIGNYKCAVTEYIVEGNLGKYTYSRFTVPSGVNEIIIEGVSNIGENPIDKYVIAEHMIKSLNIEGATVEGNKKDGTGDNKEGSKDNTKEDKK